MYDTAVPESRRKNIEELEELRREAWNLGQEDFGSVKLQKRFEGMEKALWLEVGDLSRYVSAETDGIPPRRKCFPAE
jgi:hypothetical protein